MSGYALIVLLRTLRQFLRHQIGFATLKATFAGFCATLPTALRQEIDRDE